MCHPRAVRGPGAGRFVRALGPFPLCVVSRVRANRNDTSDRAMGPAAGEQALRDGPSLPLGTVAREGCGSLERVEIFQMRPIARRFTPVSRSRCGAGGADRGPGAGGFALCLGPPPLCVVSLVQANGNDIPDRCLGPAAESTPSGWAVPAAGHRGPAGLRIARAGRDLPSAH